MVKAIKSKDAKKRKNLPQDYSKRMRSEDPMYWSQPFIVRMYLRAFYAIEGFLGTIYFFDVFAGAPDWMQIVMGVCVAICILLFRIAYPAGGSTIWIWMMEGMAEAAAEQEANGKKPSTTSESIKQAVDGLKQSQAEINEVFKENHERIKAEKAAEKAEKKAARQAARNAKKNN